MLKDSNLTTSRLFGCVIIGPLRRKHVPILFKGIVFHRLIYYKRADRDRKNGYGFCTIVSHWP